MSANEQEAERGEEPLESSAPSEETLAADTPEADELENVADEADEDDADEDDADEDDADEDDAFAEVVPAAVSDEQDEDDLRDTQQVASADELLRSGVLQRVAAQVAPGRRQPELELCAQLFSAHKPLTELELAEALGLEVVAVQRSLAALERTLEGSPFGVFRRQTTVPGKITKTISGYVLDLKPVFRRSVVAVGRPVLSPALTETLALIALNQPIMQARLVRERGSSVYEHVKELVQRDWVQKIRRGRSSELRTTDTFAAEFGLQNDPELIKRALARAAGLEGDPQLVASERVAFEHQEAVTLYEEAQQFVPSADELARREQERLAREAAAAAARAMLLGPEAGPAPAPSAPVAGPAPAALDPFARLAAALEQSERDPREDCVVSGGAAPAAPRAPLAPSAPGVASELPAHFGEGLVSGGEPPAANRLAEVLREDALQRAREREEAAENEQAKAKEKTEAQARIGHLLNLLGDDSTDDDW